jgi:Domain of unknown function (DUF3127)
MVQSSTTVTGFYLGANTEKIVGEKNTRVRKFWLDLTDNPEYPNRVEFSLVGDKCKLVDELVVKAPYKVYFNLRGNKVETKEGKFVVIHNIDAWKIEQVYAPIIETKKIVEDDDLPF